MTHSRDKQDIFVFDFFKKKQEGYFIDVGCQYPVIGNNTFLLENNNWVGISFDIIDYSQEWKQRKTLFIQLDALKCDFTSLFEEHQIPMIVDYLSLDVEGNGDRFGVLINVFKSNRDFKIITLEHDAYLGFEKTERARQREFLTENNYLLLCSNVMCVYGAFEDWWINPKYFNSEDYKYLVCEGKYPNDIIKILTHKK